MAILGEKKRLRRFTWCLSLAATRATRGITHEIACGQDWTFAIGRQVGNNRNADGLR